MQIASKLPEIGTTIFTKMSALAQASGAINLSQGFPDYPIDQRLKDLVDIHIQKNANQYAPMAGIPELRQAISEKLLKCYDSVVHPDTEITITNGATEALYNAIASFICQGDEVIIFEPAYDSYAPVIRLHGGTVLPIRLTAPQFSVNWEEVESFISNRTRAIMINSPHNPTGTTFSDADMKSLEAIATKHDLLVISDEVYQHVIYDDKKHHSALMYEGLRDRTVVTMSFGKSFHVTGWRVGYSVASPALTSEMRKVHQFNTFSINRPIQHALADYLQEPLHYLGLPEFFEKKRDRFISQLDKSKFKILPCEGTYFVCARYDTISQEDDVSFAEKMTTEHGVAVIPISVFYSDHYDQNIIRFCFAKSEEVLDEASELLLQL